ncbi:MAG: hypothetical protein KBS72_06650 [Bacteroidales bacterium]|nr:hypothetical protein [Candidatus Cacconaster scatequi]
MKKAILYSLIFAGILLFAASCEKEPQIPVTPPSTEQDRKKAEEERIKKLIAEDEDYDAKVSLLEMYGDGGSGFTPYYYWYTEVADRNEKLKPYDYGDIYTWFDALLYLPTDRWSWMMDKETYVGMETGASSGPSGTWGVSLVQPVDEFNDYRLFILEVMPGSPFEEFGVTRGAQLMGIGDLEIPEGFKKQAQIDQFSEYYGQSPMNFTFRLADGRDTSFTAEMVYDLRTNYILKTDIFTAEDFPGLTEPVGYFHYLSFKANFLDDMKSEMAKFKEAGVRKMIVDLRYNGGGDSRASDLLMSYLAPPDAAGKPYVVRKHNSLLSKQDQTDIIPEGNSLELDEVFFIMHESSASASEMTYNGLRPYLKDKLHHVGGQTYGKPNGMYVFLYPPDDDTYDRVDAGDYSTLEYVFLPICFFNFNSEGEGIPSASESESGFMPEYSVYDDPYHDFGPQEADIKACLNYIVNGTFASADDEPADDDSAVTKAFASRRGIKAIFSEAETNPYYGTCTRPLPKEFRNHNLQ